MKKKIKCVQVAIRNLVASLDTTDADVGRLAELSRSHTDMIVALNKRLADLEGTLTREFSIGDDETGRVLWYEGEEPQVPGEGETVEVRYVTQWRTSE